LAATGKSGKEKPIQLLQLVTNRGNDNWCVISAGTTLNPAGDLYGVKAKNFSYRGCVSFLLLVRIFIERFPASGVGGEKEGPKL
jgi:hypothetical protein